MSGRFADPRVVDLAQATAELRARRRILREQRRRNFARKLRRLHVPRSALWVAAFYLALASCLALWRHWNEVGLPRLVMGTLLLFCVVLFAGREVVWTHPICMVLVPAAIVVATFFFYPLAPAAALIATAFVANMWLA